MKRSNIYLYTLCFALLFSMSAQAGLLSGLGKLGKSGKKSDGAADGAVSAGRHSDNALGKGMHGDEAIGGAGGYLDEISLPEAATEIGGALLNAGTQIVETASEAAVEEALTIAAETAFPESPENQALLKRFLLDEPQTLDRNNRGIRLFTRASIKARANTIYIGKAQNKIKSTAVSQFICNNGSQWQRYTTLQSLLAKAIKGECKLRQRKSVLFLNHGAFVDYQAKQIPANQTVIGAYTYAADSASTKVHKVDLSQHIRRLENCCLYGDKSVHPGIKNSLDTVAIGTENNTHVVHAGPASDIIKQLAEQKKFKLTEVNSLTQLHGVVDTAKRGFRNLIIISNESKLGQYTFGGNTIKSKIKMTDSNVGMLLINAKQFQDAVIQRSFESNNVWGLLASIGYTQQPLVLNQVNKSSQFATYAGNSKGNLAPIQVAFTLKTDSNSCNPYIWDCPEKPVELDENNLIISIIVIIICIILLWKMYKLLKRFQNYAISRINSFFRK